MPHANEFDRARTLFRQNGGTLRTDHAVALGLHPTTLHAMHLAGELELVRRGCYKLPDLAPLGLADIVTVAQAAPRGVICLVSALQFHGLTTHQPCAVDLALPPKVKPPDLARPPIRRFWYSGKAFTAGVATYVIEGSPVRMYCPAKTIADCFYHRRKLGKPLVQEALQLCRESKNVRDEDLLSFARICGAERAITQHLDASP